MDRQRRKAIVTLLLAEDRARLENDAPSFIFSMHERAALKITRDEERQIGNITPLEIIEYERENPRRVLPDLPDALVRAASQGSSSGGADDPTSRVVASIRASTPLARIWALIGEPEWTRNARSTVKAYIFACFSELAYLHLTKNELKQRDRYKIFGPPSIAMREVLRRGPDIQLKAVLDGFDFQTQILEIGNYVYVVIKAGRFTVVAIRGTIPSHISDWLINLSARRIPLASTKPPLFCHAGFLREAVLALTHTDLRREIGQSSPVYFTGHSLGGAVASILSLLWAPRPMTPYVFGSPRFGSADVVKGVGPYDYVTADDLVPHMPPSVFGYADPRARATLPYGRPLLRGSFALARWAAKVPLLPLWWFPPAPKFASEHSIERYRYMIGEQIKERFPQEIYASILRSGRARIR